MKLLKYEKKQNIATVTLNNPARFNILSIELMDELKDLLMNINNQDDIVVIVLTGSNKTFSAGADLKIIKEMTAAECQIYNRKIIELFDTIERTPIPVIAAINGHAFGGGLEMALSCSIRIASAEAKMGLPEVKLGILPGAGGTQRLPRLIPKSKALMLLLTGDTITAQEAEQLGIVDQVIPSEELQDYCLELAQRIARNAPLAVKAINRSVKVGSELTLEQAISFTENQLELLNNSKDRKEGIQAFLEKRNANFIGK